MKKSISEAQVKRMRNLVTKKYGAKTEIRAGYTKKRDNRIEGEVWQERGKTWTIKNGIKQNILNLVKPEEQLENHCVALSVAVRWTLNGTRKCGKYTVCVLLV